MTDLSQLLKRLWTAKSLSKLVIVVILIGIADTAYLTANYYLGSEVKCIITEGCEVVLTSQYSKFFSVPLAALGLAFYIGMFILVNIFDIYKERSILKLIMTGGIVGFIISLVLLYLQLFVLKALCFYCLTSLATSTAVFVLAIILYKNDNEVKI